MQARRMVWTMLAVSIYLGLFPTGHGPTAPVTASDATTPDTATYDECVSIGADGRVTITPGDCTPATATAR